MTIRNGAGYKTRTIAAAMLLASTMLGGVGATPAQAQAESRQRSFDIPAQPLAEAIMAFGRQSGIQVTAPADLVAGHTSSAVSGDLAPAAALSRMLVGTGLTFRFIRPNVVTLERAPRGVDGAIQLGPVRVESEGASASTHVPPRQAEIGNLPPEYTGGQVARGGNLGILGNQDFMDAPFSQTSFTQATMQNQQARTIQDVLNNDSSVQQEYARGTGQAGYHVRGAEVGTSFNGLYGLLNLGSTGTAVETLERVEIIKGPNVLLNGLGPESSLGGTVNLVPKRASVEPLTSITGTYYSDGQFGGHLDFGRRFGANEQFGIRFNGVYRDGDTAIDRQSEKTEVAALALDYRSNVFRVSVDAGYQRLHLDGSRRYIALASGVPVPSPPDSSVNYSQPWTFRDDENLYGALRAELDIHDNLTAFAAGGLARHLGASIFLNPTLTDDQGSLSLRQTLNRYTLYYEISTIETGFRGLFATGSVDHSFSVAYSNFWYETGVDLASSLTTLPVSNLYDPVYVQKPDFGPSFYTGGPLAEPENAPKGGALERPSFAIANTSAFLDDRIQLTLGIRYQQVKAKNLDRATGDEISSYNEAAWSPAVGLVVKPWRAISFYANYIEGLSSGPTAPIDAENAGEIFAPYATKQYEIGAKADFGDWAATLALFEITDPNSFTDPATNIFGLNGEVRRRGLELSTFGEPLKGLRILAGMTVLDAELHRTLNGINEGNNAAGYSDFQAVLGGEWDPSFVPGLTLTGRFTYASEKPVTDANLDELPDWIRLDVGMRYKFPSSGLPITIRANVQNLLDNDHWASAGASGGGRLSLGEPRTFLLSATYDF